jgi:hypothetical protein
VAGIRAFRILQATISALWLQYRARLGDQRIIGAGAHGNVIDEVRPASTAAMPAAIANESVSSRR